MGRLRSMPLCSQHPPTPDKGYVIGSFTAVVAAAVLMCALKKDVKPSTFPNSNRIFLWRVSWPPRPHWSASSNRLVISLLRKRQLKQMIP